MPARSARTMNLRSSAEAPLHLVHLRNMETVTHMGGVIFPPLATFYRRPASVEEMVDQTLGRGLDLLKIAHTHWRPSGQARRLGHHLGRAFDHRTVPPRAHALRLQEVTLVLVF